MSRSPLTATACTTSFPEAEDVATFDRSDRKFVAVALVHGGQPPIYNAVDSDWSEHAQALARHGVRVEELCLDEP